MTHGAYLFGLLLSIIGMSLLDRRFKLAFWYDRRRTLLVVLLSIIVFTIWDLSAIGLGIFIHGSSQYMLPFTILPHFPLEEIFFLALLCYCTLVIYRGGEKLWQRT